MTFGEKVLCWLVGFAMIAQIVFVSFSITIAGRDAQLYRAMKLQDAPPPADCPEPVEAVDEGELLPIPQPVSVLVKPKPDFGPGPPDPLEEREPCYACKLFRRQLEARIKDRKERPERCTDTGWFPPLPKAFDLPAELTPGPDGD